MGRFLYCQTLFPETFQLRLVFRTLINLFWSIFSKYLQSKTFDRLPNKIIKDLNRDMIQNVSLMYGNPIQTLRLLM